MAVAGGGVRASADVRCDTRSQCAARRHHSYRAGVKGPAAGLSQQVGEAEGSPSVEMHARVVSSPDNDGTGRHCQTVRVRQARREGVREEPVVMLRKRVAGSNLADMGRNAARDSAGGGVNSEAGYATPVGRPR